MLYKNRTFQILPLIGNEPSFDDEEEEDSYYDEYSLLGEDTGDKPDPNELPSADKEVSYIIKYGKCKKCGFGDVGVAKTVEIYDYDIMDIKRFMMDPLSSNDKYYNPRITND